MKTKTMLILSLLLGVMLELEVHAFYNPTMGRWLSRDPIHEAASVPSQIRALTASKAYYEPSIAVYYALGYDDGYDEFGYDDGLNPYRFVQNSPHAEADTLGTGVFCSCPALVIPPTPAFTPIGPPFARGSRVARPTWTVPCVPRTVTAACGVACTGVCAYDAVWFWRRVNVFGTMTWTWVLASGPNNLFETCN